MALLNGQMYQLKKIADTFTIVNVIPEKWEVVGKNKVNDNVIISCPTGAVTQIPRVGEVWSATTVAGGTKWTIQSRIFPKPASNYQQGDTIIGDGSLVVDADGNTRVPDGKNIIVELPDGSSHNVRDGAKIAQDLAQLDERVTTEGHETTLRLDELDSDLEGVDGAVIQLGSDLGALNSNLSALGQELATTNQDLDTVFQNVQETREIAETADGRYTVSNREPTALDAENRPLGAIWEVRSGGTSLRRYVLSEKSGGTEWALIQVGHDFVGDDAIGSNNIGDDAIGSGHIGNDAIGAEHIGNAVIGTAHIGDAAIGTAQIGDAVITDAKILELHGEKIIAETIGVDQLMANSVGADQIIGNSIIGEHIAGETITGDKMVANSIGAREITAKSISAEHITVAPGNLFPDPYLMAAKGDDIGWDNEIAGLIEYGYDPGFQGMILKLTANGQHSGTFYRPNMWDVLNLAPGVSYRISMRVRFEGDLEQLSIYLRYLNNDGQVVEVSERPNNRVQKETSLVGGNGAIISRIITVPDDCSGFCTIGLFLETPDPDPTPPAIPDAPIVLVSGQRVDVSWTAPADGGSPITGYVVTITPTDGDPFVETFAADTFTAMFVEVPAETYIATVEAVNTIGSAISPGIQFVVEEPEPEPEEGGEGETQMQQTQQVQEGQVFGGTVQTMTLGFPEGSVTIGEIVLTPAADSSLVVDGAIRGRHITAHDVSAELIQSNTFRTSAGADGTYAVMNNTGFQVYRPEEGDTSEVAKLVHLGPHDENLLTVGDSTIDEIGGITGTVGSFDQIYLGGEELGGALARGPRGIVGYAVREKNGWSHSVPAAIRNIGLKVQLEPNRTYRVSQTPIELAGTTGGMFHYTRLGYFTGEWVDHANVNWMTHAESYSNLNSWPMTMPGTEFIYTTGDEPEEDITFISSVNLGREPNGSWYINASTARKNYLTVEDIGPAVGATTTLYQDRPDSTPSVPTPKAFDITFTSNAHACFFTGTSNRVTDGKLYQGSYNWSDNRETAYYFPSMTSALSGATISSIYLSAKSGHWWYGAGGTGRFHVHGQTAGATTGGMNKNHIGDVANWPRSATRGIYVPSYLFDMYKNGTLKGFGFRSDSLDPLYYGTFWGGATIRIRGVK